MFKLLEKWLVLYILIFIAGFSVLGIGLSFAFKDFFYKQQQNIILNNAIRIENVLLTHMMERTTLIIILKQNLVL